MVDADAVDQGVLPVLAGAAAVGGQDLGNATVAALDPTLGWGVARLDEAVVDGVGDTDLVAQRVTGRLALAGSAAPVGHRLEHPGHLEGGGRQEAFQEALGAGGGLLGKDLDVDPAGDAVDAREPVAARVFVGPLAPGILVQVD